MYRSPKPARPARPCVHLTSSSLVTPQAPAERGEGSCCTVCPSPGGAVPAGLARSREKPEGRTRSAAEGEHRTGEDFSAAALDRTSQALGQGPPCIGDGRAVQHPRAADSTHPPWHATALPGQLPAGSWGHFRARKSIDGANKQAPRASEARSARQGAAASGIKSRPPGRARRRRRLDAQHQSPTRTPGRRTPRLYRCHRSSSLSVGQAESLRGLAPTPITSPRQKCLPRGGQPVPRIDDLEAPPQCYSAHHPDPGSPP